MNYNHNLFFLLNRIKNFFKPTVRTIPANVNALLSHLSGKNAIEQFSDLYYRNHNELIWRGTKILKNPCDLWTMIDLIAELRPGLIIETGTADGGSALFYKDISDLFGIDCEIITIDINPKWNFDPCIRKITSLVGLSVDSSIYSAVTDVAAGAKAAGRHVLVCLDSEHSESNVNEELRLYAPLVTVGSYCIVEDTNVNGHPSFPDHGPGPWEAAQFFVSQNSNFVVDRDRQKYLLTFNPDGYLKRIS